MADVSIQAEKDAAEALLLEMAINGVELALKILASVSKFEIFVAGDPSMINKHFRIALQSTELVNQALGRMQDVAAIKRVAREQ